MAALTEQGGVNMSDVIVKTYKGSQEEATKLFQKDAGGMATKGYFPTSQSYAPGSYGCGAFLLALLLCFLIIGILALIYMLIVKPKGVLTVTYEFRGTAVSNINDEKTCPNCAEQVKAAALMCRFCNYKFDTSTLVSIQEIAQNATQEKEDFERSADKQTFDYQLGKSIAPLSNGKSKKSKKMLIVLISILFVSVLIHEQFNDSTLYANKSTGPTEITNIVSYNKLTIDGSINSQISNLLGWSIGKDIHNKYGLESSQKELVDPKKILFKNKEIIEGYLGKPFSKLDNTIKYKTNYGIVSAKFYEKICFDLTVDFSENYSSYFDVLKAVGINNLKRPFGVNDSTLKYDGGLGNGLFKHCENKKCVESVVVHLPKSNSEGKWAITFFGTERP